MKRLAVSRLTSKDPVQISWRKKNKNKRSRSSCGVASHVQTESTLQRMIYPNRQRAKSSGLGWDHLSNHDTYKAISRRIPPLTSFGFCTVWFDQFLILLLLLLDVWNDTRVPTWWTLQYTMFFRVLTCLFAFFFFFWL